MLCKLFIHVCEPDPQHATATVHRYGRGQRYQRRTPKAAQKALKSRCNLTCARCRTCAGDRLPTGSDGHSAAPPSPPDVSSHRSCPSGLLRHRAPWPCSSCSQSLESETDTSVLGRPGSHRLFALLFLITWVLLHLPPAELLYVDVEPSDEFLVRASCSSARTNPDELSFCQWL